MYYFWCLFPIDQTIWGVNVHRKRIHDMVKYWIGNNSYSNLGTNSRRSRTKKHEKKENTKKKKKNKNTKMKNKKQNHNITQLSSVWRAAQFWELETFCWSKETYVNIN